MARRGRRLVALAVVLLALVAPTWAQHLTSFDKAALGERGNFYWPYELDGNPNTREWLGMRYALSGRTEYRVMVPCASGLVQTEWFDPWSEIPVTEFMTWDLRQVGHVTLFVAQGMSTYHEVRFVVPTCEGGR